MELTNIMLNKTKDAFESSGIKNAVTGTKIANKCYKDLPKDDLGFFDVVECFIYSEDISLFSVAPQWLMILSKENRDCFPYWLKRNSSRTN